MGYVLFLFVSMKKLIVFDKVFYSPNGICHIVFDFLVLQSEHLDTLAVQELRAFRIASFGLLAFMHCPVHFYAQLDFRAIEIHHIRPEAMLSAEFESVDLSAAVSKVCVHTGWILCEAVGGTPCHKEGWSCACEVVRMDVFIL